MLLLYYIRFIHSKRRENEVDDNHNLVMKGDAWFGSVNSAANLAQRGINSVMQVKTAYSMYPKDYIENLMDGMPGGVHVVMKGRHPNRHNVIAIGYRYS